MVAWDRTELVNEERAAATPPCAQATAAAGWWHAGGEDGGDGGGICDEDGGGNPAWCSTDLQRRQPPCAKAQTAAEASTRRQQGPRPWTPAPQLGFQLIHRTTTKIWKVRKKTGGRRTRRSTANGHVPGDGLWPEMTTWEQCWISQRLGNALARLGTRR